MKPMEPDEIVRRLCGPKRQPPVKLVLDREEVLEALREGIAWAKKTTQELRQGERPVHPAFDRLPLTAA